MPGRLGFAVGDISFFKYRTEDSAASTAVRRNQQTRGVDLGYAGCLDPTTNVSPLLFSGAGANGHRGEYEDDWLLRVRDADLTLAFGVEWFVYRRVALSREYVGSLFSQHEQTDGLTSPNHGSHDNGERRDGPRQCPHGHRRVAAGPSGG
jgi:hypothetical protein